MTAPYGLNLVSVAVDLVPVGAGLKTPCFNALTWNTGLVVCYPLLTLAAPLSTRQTTQHLSPHAHPPITLVSNLLPLCCLQTATPATAALAPDVSLAPLVRPPLVAPSLAPPPPLQPPGALESGRSIGSGAPCCRAFPNNPVES